MITTVTLNPMVDKTVQIDVLRRGEIHRALSLDVTAGGKGINVSRQLVTLGMKTMATGFLGGKTGAIVRELLDHEGIPNEFIETPKPTRKGVTYRERDGLSTAVFEPSEQVPVDCVHRLARKISELAAASSWIVCSGSSPGEAADDVYYEAIFSAHKSNTKSVLDSYGEALARGWNALPTLVKVNRHEYETTFGRPVGHEKEVVEAMQHAIGTGIGSVVITNGEGPVYAATGDGLWKAEPPPTRAVNAVGSGDAMVAGMLYGFEQKWDFRQTLVFGIAAGVANAAVWEVARSPMNAIRERIEQIRITPIA